VALILTVICDSVMFLALVIWIKRKGDRTEMEEHSITPEALQACWAADPKQELRIPQPGNTSLLLPAPVQRPSANGQNLISPRLDFSQNETGRHTTS
jgi:hypothetical protein